MPKLKGRTLPLSPARRLVCDLLHFARRVPSVPVQRRMDLSPLRDARAALPKRPAWVTLFAKGFAEVAAGVPELRRAYLDWPWARLYEHPVSVASVAVARQVDGEEAVLFAKLDDPEAHTTEELEAQLQRYRTAPVESVPQFRRALAVSRLPWPLRRAAWWFALNRGGARRAKMFGTFGVSSYSGLGAESLHPISPLTCTLNFGVIAADGSADVRVVYDHRVMDGSTVARAIGRLEEVLNGPVADELRDAARPAGRRAEPASGPQARKEHAGAP